MIGRCREKGRKIRVDKITPQEKTEKKPKGEDELVSVVRRSATPLKTFGMKAFLKKGGTPHIVN